MSEQFCDYLASVLTNIEHRHYRCMDMQNSRLVQLLLETPHYLLLSFLCFSLLCEAKEGKDRENI